VRFEVIKAVWIYRFKSSDMSHCVRRKHFPFVTYLLTKDTT